MWATLVPSDLIARSLPQEFVQRRISFASELIRNCPTSFSRFSSSFLGERPIGVGLGVHASNLGNWRAGMDVAPGRSDCEG